MHELPTNLAIGRRIQVAREAKGLNQAELADRLEIASHQTVSELEKGNRRLQPDELVRLAAALGQSIEYFVDPFSLQGEAKYSWRRSPESEPEIADDFSSQADRLVGLLRWLRLNEQCAGSPLKSALRLSNCSTFQDAEDAGERLAEVLRLGPVPAQRLQQNIEQHLDVPVLHVDMDTGHGEGQLSGATVHLADFTCILINRNDPAGRRAFDLAHELFHALTWDAMPPQEFESNSIGTNGSAKKNRVEQLADKFAASLLMPRKLLESKFSNTDSKNVTRLRALSSYFGVSPAALAWRLLSLKLISRATCEALRGKASQDPYADHPKLYSLTFMELLGRALREGRLSPRKTAKLLSMSLDELGDLFSEYGLDTPFEI